MMIRDPHFWKRFSVAVHKDDLAKEELAKQDGKNADTWLARQKKKERHRAWLCWAFWGVLALLIVSAVVTVVVLKAHGIVKF
ncbi:hypothetical protein PtrSN002B_005909 [Pyrenophora tritici-repentis]|uniref:Uncharacterized protein n=1 Tax=Pyrenophora tritici-repentis TaxID=45151 RepID=A0A2W1EMQ1_9PLEO|nr:hypothetical protein PtrV1_05874 [Pyrenophora tritici-repentis]KAF7450608.1 hypothetical protein A1F99_052240 [Pyrenophora tritici-repentis]KAF7573225.1 hypothetical protein PtrM4_081300 [Pyrenophora tritici-repentis]KAG9381175.1 hypothetical protein A1F94_008495 [Pyrenophora tritici-repentis]KAI0581865.1 hypothetical protein Alg130_06388 [Pyrenophora tritici-repentis]